MGKRKIDKHDIEAEREGIAITKHNKIVIHAPKLKTLYVVDGEKFRTGEKHHRVIQSW